MYKRAKLNPYKPSKPAQPSKYKSYKKYLIQNNLYTLLPYLDVPSLINFMLTCKLFHTVATSSDELWYNVYCRLYKKELPYDTHRTNWRKYLIQLNQTKYEKNYSQIQKAYLTKYKKNIYTAKKDHYFLSNNLYSKITPSYYIQINKQIFPIKNILSNKILSHINFHINFDTTYIDLYSVMNIKLLFTEQNLGIRSIPIIEYNLKQIKLSTTDKDGLTSKICKVYYYRDLIISTFDKNYIFFINISLPICKICEKVFAFINGIHDRNLNYACDSDSKFGLYDYSLLINLKSWNRIYYSLSVNTCDLKEEKGNGFELYYINEGTVVSKFPIKFDIKTMCMKDVIENFMIFDIVMLSYNGDHVLCESSPIVVNEDKTRVDYDDYNCKHYIASISDTRYTAVMKFNFSKEHKYYALVYVEIRFDRKFIESIFKKF